MKALEMAGLGFIYVIDYEDGTGRFLTDRRYPRCAWTN
jgi:hypothetical protein